MWLSPDARRKNLDAALITLLHRLGEGQFGAFFIQCSEYPDILPTTWMELEGKGLIRDLNMNFEMYQFTPFGYVTALKLSGRFAEQQFREDLRKLCQVLKDSLRGRSDFALVAFDDLVRQSGVSQAFAYNALDADLIRHLLGKIGAEWAGKVLVRVPHDFGLSPI